MELPEDCLFGTSYLEILPLSFRLTVYKPIICVNEWPIVLGGKKSILFIRIFCGKFYRPIAVCDFFF